MRAFHAFRRGIANLPAWTVLLAAVLLVAFWVGLLAELDHARRGYIANAERESASMVRAFAEQARRTFRSGEGLLRQIERDLAQGQDPDLATILDRNPDLFGLGGYIGVFDADGNVVLSARGHSQRTTNAADRAWFQAIRAAAPGTFLMGKPIIGRSSARWAIPLVVRREAADGAFAGALYLSILCEAFENFYTSADVGQMGASSIFGLDGMVYVRRAQGPQRVGQSYPDIELLRRAREKPVGTFRSQDVLDGMPRVVSYRALGEYPLVASVALSEREVLAPFNIQRHVMLAQGAALTLAGLLLAGVTAYLLGRERRVRATAAQSEQRLRDAIESIDAGFVLFDADDKLVLRNLKYLDFVPFLRDLPDVRGLHYGDILRAGAAAGWHLDAEAQEDPEGWIATRLAQHRDPPPEPVEMQLGDGRWMQISERRTVDGSIVGIRTDVTRRKEQEKALRDSEENLQRLVSELEYSRTQLEKQAADLARLAEETEGAKQRAEAANVSKSQFLANMSHELRTPLNAIIGFSDMMRSELLGPIGSPRYIEYAADIHASGTHLLSLINDILDMSKIEAGRYAIRPETLDGAEVMRACARLVRVRATEANVALSVDATAVLPLQADERALKQILLNLLTNAIKFTPSRGRVVLSATCDPGGITFRVADTGIGIPAEALPRIGMRFEQVDNALTRKGEGTGLGLALCRALAELHGGRLSIESEVGRGTTVTVWLPAGRRANERAA